MARHVCGAQGRAAERDRIAVADRLKCQLAGLLVVGGDGVVRMEEVGHLPARGGSARAADVVRVDMRIDDCRGRRLQRREQGVVALYVPARIHDDGVAIAHQDVAERPLADTIELDHVGQ